MALTADKVKDAQHDAEGAIQIAKAFGQDTSVKEKELRALLKGYANLKMACYLLSGVALFGFICVIITMFSRGQFTGLALLMAVASVILLMPDRVLGLVLGATGLLILVALLSLLIGRKITGDGEARGSAGGIIVALFTSCVGIAFLAIALFTFFKTPSSSAGDLAGSTKPSASTNQSTKPDSAVPATSQPTRSATSTATGGVVPSTGKTDQTKPPPDSNDK